jgi:hypothetical protein
MALLNIMKFIFFREYVFFLSVHVYLKHKQENITVEIILMLLFLFGFFSVMIKFFCLIGNLNLHEQKYL